MARVYVSAETAGTPPELLRRVDLGSIPMKVNLLPKRRRLQGSLDSEYPRKSHATLIPLMVII
jgi:hypothetical protein